MNIRFKHIFIISLYYYLTSYFTFFIAWNDFDAIPRSASIYGLSDHAGSRKRLMFSRRQADREHADFLMEQANAKLPFVDTRRLKLISDMSVENS